MIVSTFLAGAPATYERGAARGRAGAAVATVLEGIACGAGIGFLLGAAVGGGGLGIAMLVAGTGGEVVLGLTWIGLLYGAPIGAVVGAVVGLPAAAVLAVVLAVAPPDDPAAIQRRTATTLALVLDALVVFLAAWTLTSDTGEDLRRRVLVVFPALAIGAVLTARLLRRSTRYLADGWNARTGWTPVRP